MPEIIKETSFDEILSNMILEYQKVSSAALSSSSDMYIKLKTLASQIFSLQSKLAWAEKQAFPQTATGKFLEYHAETRGLTRKTSSKSNGVLTFSVCQPSSTDIIIPKNTICFSSLNPDIKFSTTEEAIIKSGKLSADAPAISLSTGSETNAPTKTITNFCSFPKSVESVTNKADFEGGSNEETDEALRKRLLDNFKNISNGSNCAYYKNIVNNYDGVLSSNVIARNRGRGTVDIVIESKNRDESLIETIKNDLCEKKEINVDIDVSFASQKKIDIDISLEKNNSFDFKTLSNAVSFLIKQYISNIEVSKPLKLASLGAKILSVPGVENYSFNSPSQDIFVDSNEIISLNKLTISEK